MEEVLGSNVEMKIGIEWELGLQRRWDDDKLAKRSQ